MPGRALVLVAFLLVPSVVAAFPWPADASPMQRTLGWIDDRTRPDGCIGAEATGSCSHVTTRDMVIALSALGEDPRRWNPGGIDAVSYLRDHRSDLETEPGDCAACRWAKTIVALESANEDPRTFGGFDYVARLLTYFDGVQVGAPNAVNDDAWTLFALMGVDDPPRDSIDTIRRFLEARQNQADGGWSWTLGAQSEPWGAATVLLSLLVSGTPTSDQVAAKAVAYLRGVPTRDGLVLQDGAPSAETTAITVQALRAAGEDVQSVAWARDGRSFPQALLALQAADGSFAHSPAGGSRFLATTQVAPALRGLPYPFRPPTLALDATAFTIAVEEEVEVRAATSDADGGPVTVAWTIDGVSAGTSSTWTGRFPTRGLHIVRAIATDDQGASRALETIIEAVPTPATPTPSSMEIVESVDAGFAEAAGPSAVPHAVPTVVAWPIVFAAMMALARRR